MILLWHAFESPGDVSAVEVFAVIITIIITNLSVILFHLHRVASRLIMFITEISVTFEYF